MKRALLLLLLTTLCVSGSVQSWHSAVVAKKRGGGGPAPGPDVWYDSVASGSTDSSTPVANEGGTGGPAGARVTPAASGSCTKLRVYVQFVNAAGTLKAALYDNSGTLLGNGTLSIVGSEPGDAFFEVTLSVPVAVTASTPYIVGYSPSGVSLNGRHLSGQASGSGALQFDDSYATFPSASVTWLDITNQFCVGMYVD